ncbi:MAG: response regulator, partial [Victivallaceae bacterium]|nr:response regulator [Victivallaceae bacterium]
PENKKKELAPEQIIFTESAAMDTLQKAVSNAQIISFLQKEYTNHNKMFITSFSCAQVNFHNFTLIFSWDETKLTVERLISRDEFDFEGKWSKALLAYRTCLKLSYRNSIEILYKDAEKRATIKQYDELVHDIDDYIDCHNQRFPDKIISKIDLSVLLNEAQFFYEKEDIASCVSKLEMILSNVHKILLYNPVCKSVKDAIINNEFQLEGKQKKNKRVLVLDDEELILNALEFFFTENDCFKNVEFEFYTNPKKAIDKIYQEKYDLIITDIRMPVFSGENINRLNKSLYKVPCIGISGYCSFNPDAGFDSFLQKPFSLNQIAEEVVKYLNLHDEYKGKTEISAQNQTVSS